jgi:hypothetical protein
MVQVFMEITADRLTRKKCELSPCGNVAIEMTVYMYLRIQHIECNSTKG